MYATELFAGPWKHHAVLNFAYMVPSTQMPLLASTISLTPKLPQIKNSGVSLSQSHPQLSSPIHFHWLLVCLISFSPESGQLHLDWRSFLCASIVSLFQSLIKTFTRERTGLFNHPGVCLLFSILSLSSISFGGTRVIIPWPTRYSTI